MSCRAAIIAITPARSPFTMEARSVLARSTLPLMRPRIKPTKYVPRYYENSALASNCLKV